MKKLLLAFMLTACLGFGNIQGAFDLFIPANLGNQCDITNMCGIAVMEVWVNGKMEGVAWQNSFVTGLQPRDFIQVCWWPSQPSEPSRCFEPLAVVAPDGNSLSWWTSAQAVCKPGKPCEVPVNKKGLRAGANNNGGSRYTVKGVYDGWR